MNPQETRILLIIIPTLLALHLALNLRALDQKDLKDRYQRFFATMISKKIFAWWVATFIMLWGYQRGSVIIPGTEWLVFTLGVFAIDVAQKKIGLDAKQAEATDPTD